MARPLKKTRLKPRNKAVMSYFKDVLGYKQRVRRTIHRIKRPDKSAIKGHTRRYFQMQLIGLWQNNDRPDVIKGPYAGYSFAWKIVDYFQMIEEADANVKANYLKSSNWTLFKVIKVTIQEFARVTRSGT